MDSSIIAVGHNIISSGSGHLFFKEATGFDVLEFVRWSTFGKLFSFSERAIYMFILRLDRNRK